MKYTRKDLIKICKKSFVNQKLWKNRDTAEAQQKAGSCLALLSAGCDFKILTEGDLKTDDQTIWLEIYFEGFASFEGGSLEEETFYLPTELRLSDGGDWY